MDYTKILTRSFEVVWKHRALWVFGILLALFGGGGGGGGFPGVPSGDGGRGGGQPIVPSLPNFDFTAIALILIAIGCVIIVLAMVGIVLRFVSRGALIGLVQELEASQTAPTVRHGFGIGLSRFWSLVGIALLVNIPLALFSLALLAFAALPILVAILSSGSRPDLNALMVLGGAGSVALLICAIFVLIAVALVVQPFYQFFQRACVVGNRGAMDSIREGYRVVRANLGNVVVLYILAIAVGIGFGIVMIPVALILIAIPFAAGIAAYFIASAVIPALIVGGVIAIPMILILIFVSGLYHAFESALWTEGYLAVMQA